MVGRIEELSILRSLEQSDESEFVAVYGRRRVGKTYLVRHVFDERFNFYLTGIANTTLIGQLANFYATLVRYFPGMEDEAMPENWFQMFQLLIKALETDDSPKKILFLDELPWLDYPKSGFVSALEHFWNSWASARRDVVLIVCGSAASWMINNLINNHGGLHNRITRRIHVSPFTLAETETYLRQKGGNFDRYQIIQLYMALGGIPFYLKAVDPGKSAAQNINDLCFLKKGMLRTEFQNLYAALFKTPTKYVAIIEALSKKAKGMERGELLQAAKLPDGGSSTKLLRELEESNFISVFPAFGKHNRYVLYQLTDFYSLFYLRFIRNSSGLDKDYWLNTMDNPEVRAWSGYAFEQVCLYHLDQIKKALGINGIQTHIAGWVGEADGQKAQIDLVIDRRDHVINLFEMKFNMDDFSLEKRDEADLRRKIAIFKAATQTKKSVYLTLITSFGLRTQPGNISMAQNHLTMDDLFAVV